jgi:PAS domain S-box-containing protein
MTTESEASGDEASKARVFEEPVPPGTRGIVEAGAGPLLLLDESGHIVHASPSARALIGARSSDLVGQKIGGLTVPEDRLRLARWLTEHQAGSRSGQPAAPSGMFQVRRRHGLRTSARLRTLPVRGANESLGVVVELQEPPEAPEGSDARLVELQRRVDEIERSNRDLEALAGAAAHDLQSPLASLAASVELLVRHAGPSLDHTSQELVGRILKSVGRMSGLIDSLLQHSGAGVGLHVVYTDGDVLVDEAIEELRPELDAIDGVVTAASIGTLMVDPGQLRSVFRNVLRNAIRYRSPERPLRISIYADDGPVQRTFTVSDNGRGIPPAHRHRVFGMFERLDTRESGSGIGLATCRRVIEAHGGRIWIDEGADGGVAVHLTLPAQPRVGG